MLKPDNPLQMASFCLASTFALRYLRLRERFDVIHCQGAASLQADVITAHSCHQAWIDFSRPTLKPPSRAWILRRLNPQHLALTTIERHQYRPGHYKRIVTVSAGVSRDIQRLYKLPARDLTVIPNGVDLREFGLESLQSDRLPGRRLLGLSDENTALLFVANEFSRKGLAVLLEAMTLLPDQVHLICVGRGNSKPFLPRVDRDGLANRVHFIPHTSNMRIYYAIADAFVFPTQYEAFSLAILEAAAAGLPLICTRVHGQEDMVIDRLNGLFIERDAVDISGKVRWLMQDRARARAMGAAARAAANAYQWDSIKNRYVEVYENVLAEKRRSNNESQTSTQVATFGKR